MIGIFAATEKSAPPGWLFAAGFLIFFPLMWCLVLWLCSWLGDWRTLANRFSEGSRVPQGRGRRVSGKVGWTNYSGCLVVEPAEDGFFLSVLTIFRPGHPLLFVPWSAVVARETKKQFWWKLETLTIAAGKDCTLVLPSGVLPVQRATTV